MRNVMQLIVDTAGACRCVYGEDLDLSALGSVRVRRVSHVEPDAAGRWSADLSPVGGPRLGSFRRRSEALQAEQRWLDEHLHGLADSVAPTSIPTGAKEVP